MILRYALEYLRLGWPVIPVNGKTPVVAWARYQNELPKEKQVRKWFQAGELNVAIVTGNISNLVVVDCDSPEDAAWWEEHHDETPLVVTTGRGGKHFYYAHPGGKVGNRAGINNRQIDIRGDGGLVVAPPSIHPETGRRYEWKNWSSDLAAALPEFLPDWIEKRKPRVAAPLSNPSMNEEGAIRYISRIQAVSGQGGHNATYRVACILHESGMSQDEALEAIRRWNETNAEPPWTDAELVHKIEDAFKRR